MIQRYEPEGCREDWGYPHKLEPAAKGRCVLYEDHEAELAELRAQCDRMKGLLKKWRAKHDGCCKPGCPECAQEGSVPDRCDLCKQTDKELGQ